MRSPRRLEPEIAKMVKAVRFQLSEALAAAMEGDDSKARKVVERDDALDNLRALVESRVHEALAEVSLGENNRRWLRGILRVAGNLEKIGDYAENIARQAAHRPEAPALWRATVADLGVAEAGDKAVETVDRAIGSFLDLDLAAARGVALLETALDDCYGSGVAAAISLLQREPERASAVITALAILKYLERVGDAALNMAESIIVIVTGERLKLGQYVQLTSLLESCGTDGDVVHFESIWEGISGARLGRVTLKTGETMVFKEGSSRKIEEEMAKHNSWREIAPDLLVPIRARHAEGERAAFLDLFVGDTLVRRLQRPGDASTKILLIERFLARLADLWDRTSEPRETPTSYVRQVRDRLPEVWAAHPDLKALRGQPIRVAGSRIPSLDEILDRLCPLEPGWAPPFSVWLHGDLNIDNILIDEEPRSFRLIDVHRAGPGDYLQDLSVLAMSFIRHPALHENPGLPACVSTVRSFAAEQAARRADSRAASRWSLALARSFITSSRLVLDDRLARRWFLKGVSLLEALTEASSLRSDEEPALFASSKGAIP